MANQPSTVTQAGITNNGVPLYGSRKGDARYVAAYDLNCDGAINIQDISQWGANIGKPFPTPRCLPGLNALLHFEQKVTAQLKKHKLPLVTLPAHMISKQFKVYSVDDMSYPSTSITKVTHI